MPSSPHSPRSMRGPEDQRLSVIAEDGDSYVPGIGSPPAVPLRSTHRPFTRRWRDAPPRASSELEPPEYSMTDDLKHRRDRLAELRDRPAVTRRGGWRRLIIIIAIIIMIFAIALGVGLGVGLSHRVSAGSTSNSADSSTMENNSTNNFPAGRFSISAFLDTVDTSCTSNPATFRCFPYSTYASSGSMSAISFNWIVSGTGSNYTISSSDNPFSITFSNVSLSLKDVGTINERYTFSTIMSKAVIPASPITSDGAQAECFFNSTVLDGALYTKMNATISRDNVSTTTNQLAWQPWPFAAEMSQTVNGGPDVPTCYEMLNGGVGTRITSGLSAQSTASRCGCNWKNFGL